MLKALVVTLIITVEGTKAWMHIGIQSRVQMSVNLKKQKGHETKEETRKGGAGWILTPIDSVVVRRGAVACSVECFLAPTTRIPRAAPGVVVIGTRSSFHLLLKDHPTDATPNLEGGKTQEGWWRGEKKKGKVLI